MAAVARDDGSHGAAQWPVERLDAYRTVLSDLVRDRVLASDKHGVPVRGNAGEQGIRRAAGKREVAEPPSPALGRFRVAVSLPDRLLITVRKELGRQRVDRPVLALELRQGRRLYQRPHVEQDRQPVRI